VGVLASVNTASPTQVIRFGVFEVDLRAGELRKQGADVTEVVAYRTVAVEADREGEPDIYRMLLERSIDVVTFTSASAVRNFVRILGAEPAADLLGSTVVACIGPVTAEAATQCNVKTTIQPSSYTIPALVDAIAKYFVARDAEKTASL
jgi:uroporphyrinogen-III synthase